MRRSSSDRVTDLVTAAGSRWPVEDSFKEAKKIGLDKHQVRTWTSWYRHTTLVMLAYAVLSAIAAAEANRHDPQMA